MHTLDVDAARSASAHRTGHRLAIERFQPCFKTGVANGQHDRSGGFVDFFASLNSSG